MCSQNTIQNDVSITKLYVVVICGAYIILDGILGTQNIIVLIFSLIEGTDVVVDSIADDVWESEDKLTITLSDKVDIWY